MEKIPNSKETIEMEARERTRKRFLDLLLPRSDTTNVTLEARQKLGKLLDEGKLDERKIELSMTEASAQEHELLETQLRELFTTLVQLPDEILNGISWHSSFVSAALLKELASQVAPEYQKRIEEITARLERLYQKKVLKVREAMALLFRDEYKRLSIINGITDESFKLSSDPAEIEFIYRKLVESLDEDPDAIYRLSHREFEELIQELLIKLGYYVELTAPTRDGGCDLIAITNDNIGIKTRYVVEAKHYRPPSKVGVNVVRQLNTVKQKYSGHHGLVVTSSYFSRDAVVENEAFYGLHLKDYDDLQQWLRKVRNL